MTSHPARLSLRAPPHLPFIQGFPGVSGDKERKQPAICGTVEVRVGVQPIKAKWVRVEIRKHESLPPGFPGSGDTWELVGEINTLWQSQGKEFDLLQTADFKFFLPLPETMPPTVEMMKGTGVWYELVAALSYRKKGGIFKSDSANIMKVTEPIRITKHELHSVWPVYNNPDQKTVVGQDLSMTIQRPGVAFGPGDRILLTAALKSNRPTPFKLRGFECTLLEVVTSIPDPKKKAQPIVKSRPIAQARCAVDESLGKGGEKSARIDMAAPADLLVTVRHAKTLEVGYELQVKAVCDGFEGPVVPGIKYVVGPYAKGSAQQAVKDIGYVEQLCGPKPAQTLSPSPDPRRQSTSTITSATTERLADFSPVPSRPYSTVPNRQSLAFPTAHPAPALTRSPSTTISDYSQPETNEAHNRYSTATFGNWNKALQTNATASPEMKDWDSAEREKMALYNSARANAASTQQSAGISLDQLGMADIPDTAPPEYAPPLPTLPGTYQAPTRPVSAYTSPDPSSSSVLSSPDLTTPEAGPSILVTPSIPGTRADQNPTSSVGLSEKEQMRRYYEARDKVSARDGSPSVNQHPILAAIPQDASGPSTSPRPPDSGLTEKEQMRRYYAARDRVQAVAEGHTGPSGSGSAVISPISAPSAGPSSNANGQGAGVSEKEQMRRYYEARERVQANAEGSAEPSGSGSTALSPLSAYSTETPTKGNTGGTGLSEKEQMRRYYEARDRVQMVSDSPKASGSASVSALPPVAYLSADDEKESMRKRFEAATSRVRQNSPVPPTSILASSPTRAIPTLPHPMTSNLPPPISGPSDSSTGSAYPSATDEKERMRRLYEEANQRVRAGANLSPPPGSSAGGSPDPSSSSTVPLSPPVDLATPFNPWPDRSMVAQIPFTPPIPSSVAGPSVRKETEEVPPPLPSRPPADYINLLSPVSDVPPAGFNRP